MCLDTHCFEAFEAGTVAPETPAWLLPVRSTHHRAPPELGDQPGLQPDSPCVLLQCLGTRGQQCPPGSLETPFLVLNTLPVLSTSLVLVWLDFFSESYFLFMKGDRRAPVPKSGRNKMNYFRERFPETISFVDINSGSW